MRREIELSSGITINLESSPGTGLTVLCLHGIPGSARTWRRCADLLEDFPLVVPDLPGFGSSSPAPQDWHVREYADALIETLDKLEIDRAVFVGHDFGGPIAVACASAAADRVAGLVLCATNVRTDTPLPGPLRLAGIPGVGEMMFAAMFSQPGLRALWKHAVVRHEELPRDEFFAAVSHPGGLQQTKAIFLRSLRNLESLYAPIEAALGDLDVPTTVVWGDSDPFFDVDVGRRAAGAIPGANLVIVPRCGHFVPGEDPGSLCAAIREVAAGVA